MSGGVGAGRGGGAPLYQFLEYFTVDPISDTPPHFLISTISIFRKFISFFWIIIEFNNTTS